MAERRPQCVPVRMRDTRTANTAVIIYIYIYMIYEDDLQLGKLKENCLLLKLLSQTQKNVIYILIS